MGKKRAAVLMLALAMSRPLFAQTQHAAKPSESGQALTLEAAVQIALQKHPALRQAEAAIRKAEAEVDEVRASYFPQLSLTGIGKIGLSGATGALGLAGFPGSPFYRNLAYSANLYQTVFDFGRTRHLVAFQKALAENARLEKQAEEARIVLAVKRAYFSALDAQRLVQLAKETARERRLTVDRARAFHEAGLESQLHVRLSEAELAHAEENRARAGRAIHTALAALATAMGVEQDIAAELEEPALEIEPQPALEEQLNSAYEHRPEVKALDAKITALTERVRRAGAERLPEVRGFAAAGQGRFAGTTVKPNQRYGAGALGLFVPLFTGGRLKAERRAAKADLDGALAARDSLRQQIRLQVIETREQLAELEKRLPLAAEQEQAAEQSLRLARARYQAQMSSFLNLTAAQLALTRAQTNRVQTAISYQRARAELDFATGRPAGH